MNRVGLDVRMIHHTGIGTYLRGLLSGVSRRSSPLQIALYGNPELLKNYRYPSTLLKPPIYSLQEQIAYRSALKECAVWHAPHYNIPFWKHKTKLVVTIHDLIHWVYRKEFFTPLQALYARVMFSRVVAAADHIIAVSQSTKQDLIQYFKASPDKVSVIYEGVEPKFNAFASFNEVNETLEKYHISSSFFLYVGSLKPHKNVGTLIRVFRDLKKAGKVRSSLVIVGKKDKNYSSSQALVKELETGGGIYYLPLVSNDDLARLYQGALGLVHPSLYEGFGLTLLEAMASGTPVMSSNTSSLPEVGGEAALYFDPLNDRSLADTLLRVEKSESVRRELREKGYHQLKKFSWDYTAQQTLQIYERLMK